MMVVRWLSKKLLQCLGWKVVGMNLLKDVPKAVLIVAPHTSNWDFFYGIVCILTCYPIRFKFAIKKTVLFFPLGPLLKQLGAIPIDKKKKQKQGSMVDVMTALLQQHATMLLIIAPEGTRSSVQRWKTGFYRIATQATVPIVVGYIDYATREIGIKTTFHPTGALEADIEAIKAFYQGKVGKYPEKSTL